MTWDDVKPEGWTLRQIGEVAKVSGGGTPKTTVKGNFSDAAGHPWITPADLTGYTDKYISHGRRFLTDQGLAESSAKYLPAGTVLFSSRAPIGYVAIAANPVTTNQGFRSFSPSEELDSEYLYHALRFLKPVAEQLARGTTFPEISGSTAATMPIAYPPLDKQRQIARILDATEVSRRAASAYLADARRSVNRLRDSILDAACSGALTSEWRDRNARLRETAEIPKSTFQRLRSIEEFDLEEIPESWRWVQVDDLLPAGGIFDGPFGSNLKTADYTDSGARVVRLENIGHLTFIHSKKTYVTNEKFRDLVRHSVRPGDIVFSSFVEEKVRVCILPDDLESRAIAKADCFTLRPSGVINPVYLSMQLASHRTYEFLASDVHGATRPRVNTTQVRSLPVPVCSREEQDQIVQTFRALIAPTEVILSRINSAGAATERTSQAMLEKAFRGELAVGRL